MSAITFTIIIPTYHRPQALANCLAALTKLNYPSELFDVIVVDDGSPIELGPSIDKVAHLLTIRLLKQPNAGPAGARNRGSREASGDYLLFTDDDCCLDANYLNVMAGQLKKTPNCIVGGRTINSLVDNPYSATSQLIVDMVYQNYNANPDEALFFASNNMVVPTAKFQALHGFNSEFRTSEDRELCDRWLAQGDTLRYCANAVVYHAHNLSLLAFCRQHFSYGQGAYRFHTLRAQRQSGNMSKEFKFHSKLSNWLINPLRPLPPVKRPAIGSLLLLWQCVNALGFFWQAGIFYLKEHKSC